MAASQGEFQTYTPPTLPIAAFQNVLATGIVTQYPIGLGALEGSDLLTLKNVVQNAINAKYLPSLPCDPRTGVGIQEAGCGDFNWLTIRTYDGFIPTTETEQGQFYIGSCSQIAIKIKWDKGNAATTTLLRWYFSDKAKTDWGQWSVLDVTAGSGGVTPKVMYIELSTANNFDGIIVIHNPGAQYIKFTIDGQATPGNAELGFEVMRSWSNTKQIEV